MNRANNDHNGRFFSWLSIKYTCKQTNKETHKYKQYTNTYGQMCDMILQRIATTQKGAFGRIGSVIRNIWNTVVMLYVGQS